MLDLPGEQSPRPLATTEESSSREAAAGAGAGGSVCRRASVPRGVPEVVAGLQRLGAKDDELVQLVEEGALPSAALPASLLHDQLRVHLVGGEKAVRRSKGACLDVTQAK